MSPAGTSRKKNAPWYGKAGENSTIWASPSPEVHHGRHRTRRSSIIPPEAGRADAAPDPEPHQARRAGVRAVPGQRHDTRRRRTDRARLLRHGAGPEVRGRASSSAGKRWLASRPRSTATGGRSRRSPRNAGGGPREWPAAAGDRGRRSPAPGRAPDVRGAVPGAGGLVAGTAADPAGMARKQKSPPRPEPGGPGRGALDATG